MYCVVCLRNRASAFLCPYCEGKVKKILTSRQLFVHVEVFEDFKSFSMPMQWKVIYLTNKRLGKMLKAGLKDEFSLNVIVSEYTQMVLTDKELEIPIRTENDDIHRQVYFQYTSPRKGEII